MERSRDWFRQAERDLTHARKATALGEFEWVCFAAQQAAEKAVKALHEAHGGHGRGHAILKLLEELEEVMVVPDRMKDAARVLDLMYIPTRDPRIQRVVLFGSLATGRATIASDADLMIVLSDHPLRPSNGFWSTSRSLAAGRLAWMCFRTRKPRWPAAWRRGIRSRGGSRRRGWSSTQETRDPGEPRHVSHPSFKMSGLAHNPRRFVFSVSP